jgi:hypothetical protein
MANTDIIRSLSRVCENWSDGKLDVEELREALIGHLSALEGRGSWEERRIASIPWEIDLAWWGRDPVHGEMPMDREAVDSMVQQLQEWLSTEATKVDL